MIDAQSTIGAAVRRVAARLAGDLNATERRAPDGLIAALAHVLGESIPD
jgi:hypothetical protein